MSTENHVMIKTDEPLSSVARRIERRLGIELESDPEWNGHILRFKGAGFFIDVMDDHGLDDDVGIPFASYPIAVRIEVAKQGDPGEFAYSLEDAMALYVGSVVFAEFKCTCLVVKNVQTILHRFEP